MKRKEFIRHLKRHGCLLLRDGGRHSIFVNLADPRLRAAVPVIPSSPTF